MIVFTNQKHLTLSALLIFVRLLFYFHLSILNSIFQPQPVNCATHNILCFISYFYQIYQSRLTAGTINTPFALTGLFSIQFILQT